MNIAQVMAGIPWWVYLVALMIVKIGVQASQTRVVPLKKLFFAPLLLIFLAVESFWNQAVLGHANVTTWIIGLLLGGFGGWMVAMRLTLTFDHANRLVKLPGTWSTLIIMLLVIAGKVGVGYASALGQGNVPNTPLLAVVFAVSGLCTGILLGRVAGYFQQFAKSKSVALELTQ